MVLNGDRTFSRGNLGNSNGSGLVANSDLSGISGDSPASGNLGQNVNANVIGSILNLDVLRTKDILPMISIMVLNGDRTLSLGRYAINTNKRVFAKLRTNSNLGAHARSNGKVFRNIR